MSVSTAPIHDAEGKIIGTMAVLEDATERKRLEQQRAQVLQFVTHDLRAPLSGLLLGASHVLKLLQQESVDPEIPSLVSGMLRSAEEMAELTRDLAEASRVRAGGLQLQLELCNVETLLQDASIIFAPLVREKGVRLTFEAQPHMLAWLDRHRILQVISNLVSNAVRFTHEGGKVDVRAAPSSDEICFSVVDSGQGIPAEDLPHIFERFWQRDQPGGGTAGLGLTIAKGIVEAHGGRIWVESEPGSGSTFTFALPISGLARGRPAL
jgi:signal transduction histidine kinase